MQKKTNWLAIFAIAMTILAVGILIHDLRETPIEVIPEGYLSESEVENVVMSEVNKVNLEKEAIIVGLEIKLAEKILEVTEKVKETLGYLIDGLLLNSVFKQDTYSDREIKTLFDGEVEFDGKDYDAEETIVLKNLTILANGKDFKGVDYLTVLEGAINYTFTFEYDLNTSLIEEDETLKFNFLGKMLEVSEWIETKITFTQGTEFYMKQGETVNVDGKVIVLDSVYEGKVYVTVGDETKRIRENEVARINGLEVYCKEVDYQAYADGYKQATLFIGEDVKFTVEDGEEYAEDSIWAWRITESSIGLMLVEEFTDLDNDEDAHNALAKDEMICLPNEYICVRYNGLSEEDTEEVTFELDDGFVEVRGSFQHELEDLDRLYINASGSIFDKNDNLLESEVTISDFDSNISTGNYIDSTQIWIQIMDFSANFDLNYTLVYDWNINDWVKIDDEEDYLTDYGILVSNPEDSIKDLEWTIVVPENGREGSITIL